MRSKTHSKGLQSLSWISELQIKKWQSALKEISKRAFEQFRPPERMTVSEWADRNRVLPVGSTSRPGLWSTDFVPYMRAIMDAFADESIEEIAFIKASQTSGTESALNMLGYTIDQKPHRLLYVMPDEDTYREFSEERLQVMLTSCDCFKGKFDENASRDGFLKFRGGFCKLTTANSPSKLASLSIPYIIMDEIDKYPRWSGREANPIKLARERSKNWPGMNKLVLISTPTLKEGNIYKAYMESDIRFRYHVPCPHCGHMQPFLWENVKFDSKEPATVVEYATHYECCECHGVIKDHHKPEMLRHGKWIPENECKGRPKKIGFAINSIYSPWITFGQVAAEFQRSKNDPADLMNFINSWLGEPWENLSANMDIGSVMDSRTEVPEHVVPRWAQLLTAGVDVQKDYFYWTIRAWGAKLTSQNIAYGMAQSWEELESIMDKFWPDEEGELRWQVQAYCVDSGYRTDEVYEYCNNHHGVAIPCKGSSSPMVGKYRPANVEPKIKGVRPSLLYIVDTDQYKNVIVSRLHRPIGVGAWMLNRDTELVYAEHLTAEHRVIRTKGGRQVEMWEKKTSAKQNHWWDCEVYAFLAADLVHVSLLDDLPEEGGE